MPGLLAGAGVQVSEERMDSDTSGARDRTCAVCGLRGDVCVVSVRVKCFLWSSLDGKGVDESRQTIQRDLAATAPDWSTSSLAATTGVLVDGCGCVMGVTAMATGVGGVSEVLSSTGAMGTDESSRAVNKELVATALDVSASSLSSMTAMGAGM